MASSVVHLLCHTLVFWLHALFGFISTVISRVKKDRNSINGNMNYSEIIPRETNVKGSENDIAEIRGSENDVEEDKQESFLEFKFPTFEEFSTNIQETGNLFNSEVVPFASGNSISASVDEQEIPNPKETVNEDRNINFPKEEISVDECFSGESLVKDDEKVDEIHVEDKENTVDDTFDKQRIEISDDDGEDDEQVIEEGNSFRSDQGFTNSFIDSYSNGFVSDGEFDFDASVDTDGENEDLDSENYLSDFDGEDSDLMEELRTLEEDNFQNPDKLTSDFLTENDFNRDFDKNSKQDSSTSNPEDANISDSLWEHQELIEQLKMELKKVKATGLPTILEESESPKIMDDLKPWKIDDRFQLEDCIDELQKFYKCYRERMRKFDILNYQKMYSIGFLQLKEDPLQSISRRKPSASTLKSLFPRNLSLFKHGAHDSDPMKNFVKELQGDLEVVYVGQICLSWEFLHWQYEKALDLWDSDPRGAHRYNEVAGEFQQFQVLMQRFIEDEPFRGPRVENYIKSRCVLRNLLQVPVIKVDSVKDKRKMREKDTYEYIITSDLLVEIVEESIRIFWRFVRADKGCNTASAKETPELHNPEDLELLMDAKKTLQKKERKLKDILRSENCILRKIRRYRDDDSDQVLYFFAQVDMKLVSRVLNMSRISREQLTWCRDKLSRISFANRKINVQPSFLLFPC